MAYSFGKLRRRVGVPFVLLNVNNDVHGLRAKERCQLVFDLGDLVQGLAIGNADHDNSSHRTKNRYVNRCPDHPQDRARRLRIGSAREYERGRRRDVEPCARRQSACR